MDCSVKNESRDTKQESTKQESTKQEISCDVENNTVHEIEFRYNNPAFIPDIAALVFDTSATNELQRNIISYLCKIGICVPCIYRICNNFRCISQQPNCNDLLHSLLTMEHKTSTKHCFICNDIYLKLYHSLITDQLFSRSSLPTFEYQSYWMTLKITPILTVRDFYIIHHLHHAIESSVPLITFPSNDRFDSHKDFLYFMIEQLSSLSTSLIDPSSTASHTNTYNNGNKFMNKFGYSDAGQVTPLGINITLSFYQHFLAQHFRMSTMESYKDKERKMTKQSKKRDRFKQWKNNKKKRQKRENMMQGNDNCPEYTFMKTFVSKQWKQKHYELNTLKTFLLDLDAFTIIIDAANDIKADTWLTHAFAPWIIPTDNADSSISDVKIEIQRPPVFIAAEYNKYSREISQTPFPFAKSSVLTLIVQQMRRWNVTDIIKESEPDTKQDDTTTTNNSEETERKDDKSSRIKNPHSNEHGWVDIKQNIASDNIFCCDHVVFHSAGREDADVRMLGKGRPVLLQLMNPRKAVSIGNTNTNELSAFEAFCNGNVSEMIALNNVRLVDEKYQEWMKSIENTKNKAYRCLCWVSKSIQNQKELDDIWNANQVSYPLLLKQWTPIRVLHRRSLAERTKQLYDVKLKWIAPQWISVDIVSEAGTYIKEFCHGDRGRTCPNLASLLGCSHANIIQLDVIAILT